MPDTDAAASSTEPELTIRGLAARTGVPEATLRTWETRYGAPRPRRLPSGHRRYTEQDVALVGRVVHHRAAGLSLSAAISLATDAASEAEHSVFAGLRQRHPDLLPRVLGKRTLLAITRAIEDECCARANRPVLFAGFQSVRFFRQSESRWRDLARTADHAVVFADFGNRTQSPDRYGITKVRLPSDASLTREWLLVCDAPDYPAAVTGWELPGQQGIADSIRSYECLWTVDARAVRDAARLCARLAAGFGHELGPRLTARLEPAAPPASPDLDRAMGLLDRVVGYVDTAG